MKLGIIGLAGAGKSTVFNAMTKSTPSDGHRGEDRLAAVSVPDARIDRLSAMYQPKKTTYARVEHLLPGRRQQGGRDADSWTAVRNCDALIHVVRNHDAGGAAAPDPAADFRRLDQELMLSDLVVVEKRLERIEADHKRGKKMNPEEHALLKACRQSLEQEIPLRRFAELCDASLLKGFALLSAKPVLVLFNNADEDEQMPDIPELVQNEPCMVIRGKLEEELAAMSADEAAEFLAEYHIAESAMDRVIRRSYEILGLISFFTVGKDEVRAWTIKKGTVAQDAAGAVHTDMKKGFIRAEVVSYEDLVEAGSYSAARKKGTVRLEGKTYVVQDADVINFRFNV